MSPDCLRIALISEHASPLASLGSVDAGGQNIYVSQVARGLARLGHRVDVFTRGDDPWLRQVVQVRPGLRVCHVRAGPPTFVPKEKMLRYMPAFMRGVQRMLEAGLHYDVVHANFFMSGLAGLRLKQRFGIPLVMTFHALGLVRREHQGAADGFPAARTDIERSVVRRADRVIAECPQDEADLMRLYGADPARISTVPCGVDIGDFHPEPRALCRARIGAAPGEFIVLQLGRLVPRKGIDNVIRAIGRLDRHIPARLLVVGGDAATPDEMRTPELARLRAVARECGVGDRVSFVGHRQGADLRTYYGAADVFVTTPWYEPFGITPLEAMACGVPVVGSAVGGIRHSVTDGVTGYLVPPKDPAALAERLAFLWSNPALAAALGRAGIRRVRAQFTWELVAARLVEVYRAVAQGQDLRGGATAHRNGRDRGAGLVANA